MRYILDVSGHDLKLIRASIVNFQRSLGMSDQAEFDNLIDDLDILFFKLSMMKKEQINNKIKRKWGNKKWSVFIKNLIEEKSISSQN